MWAALKSDLSEVISGIKDESSTAINNVSNSVNRNDAEETGNAVEEDVYEDDQDVMLDDGMVLHHANNGESMYAQTGIVSCPADEVALLREREETYLQTLVPWEVNGQDISNDCLVDEAQQHEQPSDDADVKLYIEQFKIEEMTEEIANVLKKYHNTVGVHFNSLAPEVVTYTQFWQRYFYRCNLSRVETRWQEEADMRERERKEMIQKGVATVTNLFGGAMKNIGIVVAPKADDDNESTYEKYQKQLQEQNEILSRSNETPSAPPFSLFGSSGRPPFVMNTADSSDEELSNVAAKKAIEELGVEVEDEEEELGWDSDEEDYDEEDDEEDSQMIEFLSPGNATPTKSSWQSENENISKEVDKLREQLEIVLEERDALQQTTEMQTKELTEMKLLKNLPSVSHSRDLEHEVQKLEMQIFEKDSELAALKASIDDSHDDNEFSPKSDNITVLQKELESMKTTIKCRDELILKLSNDAEKHSNEIQNVTTQLALREEELIAIKSNLCETEQQRDALSQELQTEKDHLISEQTKILEKQVSQEQTISEIRSLLESSSKKNVELEKEMGVMKTKKNFLEENSMKSIVREDLANESNSGSTGSSGVVHVPLESSIAKDRNDDEDDWGDEW